MSDSKDSNYIKKSIEFLLNAIKLSNFSLIPKEVFNYSKI